MAEEPRDVNQTVPCRAGLGAQRSARSRTAVTFAPECALMEPAVGHAIAICIAMVPMVEGGVSWHHCDDQGPRANGFMSRRGARALVRRKVSSWSACPGSPLLLCVRDAERVYLSVRPRPHCGRRDI